MPGWLVIRPSSMAAVDPTPGSGSSTHCASTVSPERSFDAALVAPLALRKFGLQPNPPELGPKVHAALCDMVASGAIKPIIGRRISMAEVGTTLQDHAERRTSGRSVVDLTLG